MFLQTILSQLKEMDTSDEILPECPKGAGIVTTLSEELRPLFALMVLYEKEMLGAIRAHQHIVVDAVLSPSCNVDSAMKQLLARPPRDVTLATTRFQAVRELFWASAREAHPEIIDQEVTVYREWKMARIPWPTPVGPGFMSLLFGEL